MKRRARFTDGWWGRESAPLREPPHLTEPGPDGVSAPVLVDDRASAVAAEVLARVPAYTPDWRPPPRGDAGTALVRLVAEEAEPVLQRVNRLPEKAFVELLRVAGIEPAPPTPAAALLVLTVSPSAGKSVLVPRGFQVGAPPAAGRGDLVTFETDYDLWATPGTLAERQLEQNGRFLALPTEGRFLPFGADPQVASALWLGLDGASAPAPTLALGFSRTPVDGAPPPVPVGGVAPLPEGPVPLLSWEIFDQGRFVRCELVEDQTANLVRGGVVTLKIPQPWRAGRPAGMPGKDARRWLRLRIVAGAFATVPWLELAAINVVRATAARTIRGEVLEAAKDAGGRRWRVSQIPVLPGSLTITVDEGGIGGTTTTWHEVADVAQAASDARVFVLDPGTGEVTFGDGLHGAIPPPGFRHIVAQRYQTGGGVVGHVDAGQITKLLKSHPFVTAASNPLPAAGGADEEPREKILLRGPQQLRARERAVTLADYELLALRAPGAQVARAHAVSGLHPGLPGKAIPGVVGVLVVPPAQPKGPYLPDEDTLRALAEHLSRHAAPAGVAVVAAAPRYHLVRVEAQLVIEAAVDEGAAIAGVLAAIDSYLDPLMGGEDGQGWPFGGTLRFAPLVRRILGVLVDGQRALSAVPLLSLVVDGLRVPLCADRPIPAHDLLWPGGHELVPVRGGAA
jgi:predicted phage baseplate assembly protein